MKASFFKAGFFVFGRLSPGRK